MTTNPDLKNFISRIETLEASKQEFVDDIKEVFGEAKSAGFDTKILRKVIAIRKIEKAEREEQEALVQTYLDAIEN